MSTKSELVEIKALCGELMRELDRERNSNKTLREMCYRHESQLARSKICESETRQFREMFSNLIYNDNRETAISIFSWENLTPSPIDFFNSKRIESQVFNFAPVFVFSDVIEIPGAGKQECPVVLPFVPDNPALDCYGEFPVVRPYSPSGAGSGDVAAFARSKDNPFKAKIVNVDGFILSDYFEYHQTTGNTSLTIREAVRIYSDLIAECENAKRQNRNWIKIPLIFSTDVPDEKGTNINKLVREINDIVAGIQDSADALLTQYAKNLLILNTKVQYFGTELENAIKDYQNKLWNFLGIGHIFNENRAQKVTAEFEKTQDEYNINIIKRLQLREKGLSVGKKIMPQWFKDVKIQVNLSGFAAQYDSDAREVESEQESDE